MSENYSIPEGSAAYECQYCDVVAPNKQIRSLHYGLSHRGDLSDRERARFERSYRNEQQAIRRFRLGALGAIIILYFGLLMVYALVI